ncbi:hypothetical protein ACWCYY_12245 [Kitasatospora sp. NPDC001664]|uniref:hypothetical protein n=1 Tax=Kitasatospora albolonga TaxID=68173 RepID=UPI0035EE0212
MTAAQWYVLIEEDTRMTKHADGVELKLHHWTLVASHPVGGSEEDALAVAEEAALKHVPDLLARHARPGDVPARQAFRAGDGSWLVWLRQHHRECHLRVTTARLVHVVEGNDAPPKTFRDRLRNALDGPAPEPTRWAPGA